MKRFKFSLETVHRYKSQVLDSLKNDYARLLQQMDTLNTQIAAHELVFEETGKKLNAQLQQGISASDISVYKLYLSDVDTRIVTLNHKKKELQCAIQKKLEEILAVNTDLAGMDKLREKQWAEYCRLEQKSDELFVEEFVSNATHAR